MSAEIYYQEGVTSREAACCVFARRANLVCHKQ